MATKIWRRIDASMMTETCAVGSTRTTKETRCGHWWLDNDRRRDATV
jgi:hypothetical protein